MVSFEFYKSTEVYREKYYQLPIIFFESDKYKNMSNDAKIAYTLLKDRFDYSIKNNWVDEDNNIYFIFTVSELMNLLNCREGKVSKIKKELTDCGLLYQKRSGSCYVNGKKENLPNKMYLGKPEVTAKDVFRTDDSSGIAKIANPNEALSDNVSSGIAKIANPNEALSDNDSSGIAKIADNLSYSNYLDTNRHYIDTEKDNLQDQILLDNFVGLMKDNSIGTFIPEKVLALIKNFSSNYSEAQQTVKTIHNAKHKAEQITNIHVVFEDISNYGINAEFNLYNTLLKAYQKQKTEKIENMQNLIFTYVKNWFVEYPCAAIKQANSTEELPKIDISSWIE
ncbi:replication initiator protein A [Enterococcus avium]|uniref:replication initiator protein A n=1 Tax=Enterococcus avium TaxID=33945 RepID=UPI000F4D514B|nr:replication initiator protein A [Enterococcus avium]MDT2432198.1 replication initiator protein A [Enterococcus avium]MDT2449892.1 replication initiator protein A [Enterococcus avium]MDT2493818.1 replication initiator protein A [Enterococcus avium]ROZ48221.1 replication protein RepA [Enterococcus avium]